MGMLRLLPATKIKKMQRIMQEVQVPEACIIGYRIFAIGKLTRSRHRNIGLASKASLVLAPFNSIVLRS